MSPDYLIKTKPLALRILDDVSLAKVVYYYGKTPGYDAKSQLFKDLGIPPDYFATLARDINGVLGQFTDSKRITSKGLRNCSSIGDFISLFCTAAGSTVPPGEPK